MIFFNYEDINTKKSRVNYHYLLESSHLIKNIKNSTEYKYFLDNPSINNTNVLFNMIFHKIFLFAADYTNIFDLEHNSISDMININTPRNPNSHYTSDYLNDFNLVYSTLKSHCILHGYFSELNKNCNTLEHISLKGSHDSYNEYTYSQTVNTKSLSLSNPKTNNGTDPYEFISQTYNHYYAEIKNTYIEAILELCSTGKDSTYNKFYKIPICYKELSRYILTDTTIKSFAKELKSENKSTTLFKNYISTANNINEHLETYSEYNDFIISHTFFEILFNQAYSKFILDFSKNKVSVSTFKDLDTKEVMSNFLSLVLDCPIVHSKDILAMYALYSKSSEHFAHFFNIINNITIPLLEDLWDIVLYDLSNSEFKSINLESIYINFISNKYNFICNSPYDLIATTKNIMHILIQIKQSLSNIEEINKQLYSFYTTIDKENLIKIISSNKNLLDENLLSSLPNDLGFNDINVLLSNIDKKFNILFNTGSVEPNLDNFDFETIIKNLTIATESTKKDNNYYLNKEPFLELIDTLAKITYYPNNITFINELETYTIYIQQIIYATFSIPKDSSTLPNTPDEKIIDAMNNSHPSKIIYLTENIVKFYIGVENTYTSIQEIICCLSNLMTRIKDININDLHTPITHLEYIMSKNNNFDNTIMSIITDLTKLLEKTTALKSINSSLLEKKRTQKKELLTQIKNAQKSNQFIPNQLKAKLKRIENELHILNKIHTYPNIKLCRKIITNINNISTNISLIKDNLKTLSNLIKKYTKPPKDLNSEYIKTITSFNNISEREYSTEARDVFCKIIQKKYTSERFQNSLVDTLTNQNQKKISNIQTQTRKFLLDRISSLNSFYSNYDKKD